MSRKQQVLSIMGRSHRALRDFVASLSEEDRAAIGSYEQWRAKDAVAHIGYWVDRRAAMLTAMARGEEPPSPPHYEQANATCFQRFARSSWEEVLAFADQAQTQLVERVRALSEDTLARPAADTGDRPLWMDIVNTGYTHLLMHLAEHHTRQKQPGKAAQLWQQWGDDVAPLDDSAVWQGTVHYNMACSLALSDNPQQAIAELRQALQLRPSMTAWSKQDPDLFILHDMPEYRELYAPEHWWKALDGSPQAEALAEQFMRTLAMFRQAVKAFPAEEWRKGDTPYQRPAGLALHIVESTDGYCAVKAGDPGSAARIAVNWEEKESARLPSQEELLAYLEDADRRLAGFLAQTDLTGAEQLFRWTGSTMLSRGIYMLRHAQHHLAEMCLELHRRGLQAPPWQ